MSFITSWVKVMAEQITMDAFLAERKESTQKRIKKQGPYQLPENWSWAKLGDICKINPSKREIKDLPDNIKVTFVPMAAVSEITGEIEKPEIRLLGEVRKGYTYFREGDVLFAKITPCMENGKSAIAKGLVNGLGFGSTEFHVLRPLGEVIPEWIHYYIRQESFREEAARSMMGSVGQQRVPKQFLVNAMIPLPPIHEQKRIVARLEELVSRAEEAKRLRRIAKEKTEKIMQAAVYKVFSRAEEEGWRRVKLGSILARKPQYGLTARSSPEEKEIRYIRISDIKDNGELKNDDPRFLDLDEKEFEKYKLEEGDILIARSGTVGRIYLHKPLKQKAVFASYLIRFKLDPNKVIPKFLFYYGFSPFYKKFIESTWRIVAQPNINAKRYCDLEIPLAPIEEQKKITAYLDKVREIVESLRKLQQRTEEELENLVPSVLDKAFKGEI